MLVPGGLGSNFDAGLVLDLLFRAVFEDESCIGFFHRIDVLGGTSFLVVKVSLTWLNLLRSPSVCAMACGTSYLGSSSASAGISIAAKAFEVR